MKELLDLTAPIIPGVGLGGLELGRNVGEYRDIIYQAATQFDAELSLAGLWEAVYRLPRVYDMGTMEEIVFWTRMLAWTRARRKGKEREPPQFPWKSLPREDAVEMYADVRDGTIYNLGALDAYRGRLLDKISIGMTFGAAAEAVPEVEQDFEGFVINGQHGVYGVLEGVPEYAPREEILDWKITQIHVFLPSKAEDGRLPY